MHSLVLLWVTGHLSPGSTALTVTMRPGRRPLGVRVRWRPRGRAERSGAPSGGPGRRFPRTLPAARVALLRVTACPLCVLVKGSGLDGESWCPRHGDLGTHTCCAMPRTSPAQTARPPLHPALAGGSPQAEPPSACAGRACTSGPRARRHNVLGDLRPDVPASFLPSSGGGSRARPRGFS